MILDQLALQNFRNIESCELLPDKKVNVIFGDNAQGKTNLLEAVWLTTGNRSFRGAKDVQLISFDRDFAKIHSEFSTEERSSEIDITIGRRLKRKRVLQNGVELDSIGQLCGQFDAVVFSPVHLSLVKDAPSFRRHFLDSLLCGLSPRYLKQLIAYQKILDQRNAFIKGGNHDDSLLDIYDYYLSQYGGKIMTDRQKICEAILPAAASVFSRMTEGEEAFSMKYECQFLKDGPKTEEELSDAFYQKLKNQIESDRLSGCTASGPHRDDLSFAINGLDVKTYGSQGQQRSTVLSLKLAECSVIEANCGEKPVVLLDDVLSELDSVRQRFILNYVEGMQVFLTCCDRSVFDGLGEGRVFEVKSGAVTPLP